jgi:hypothetical protein
MCATYLVGFLIFLPYQQILIFWSAIAFTPLVAVTLSMTRSEQVARFAVPVVLCALLAAAWLFYSGVNGQGIPRSTIYNVTWLVGALGPFVLFFIVSRHLRQRSAPGN